MTSSVDHADGTPTKDYYALLGLKKTATPEEILQSLSASLPRKYHPDVNPEDKKAEEKFKEISEANDVLSDEKKRKIYDQFGFYSDQIDPAAAEAAARGGYGGFPGAGQARRSGPQGVPIDFGGFDFSDFSSPNEVRHPVPRLNLEQLSPDIFSGVFSQSHKQQRGPQPGTDLEYQIDIDFWTSIRGGTVRLQVMRQEVRPTCKGKASRPAVAPAECNGSGRGAADGRPHEI